MNNKGFTLVELIVSFVLVSVISIFLFQVVSIISSIYSEEGIKTELVLEQSSISNIINKDILLNEKNGNYVRRIVYINDNQLDIRFLDGSNKTIFVDHKKNTISYGSFTQKFLNGTKIGNIEFDFDYLTDTSLKYNGLSYIKIPITYGNLDSTFDVLTLIRFDSNEYAINLEDNPPIYAEYRKYNDGTPIYFNVTTGLECTKTEQESNYATNNVDNALASGCMKFYAFLDSDKLPYVDMILDHNITLADIRPTSLTNFKNITSTWQGVEAPTSHIQHFYNPDHDTATLYSNWASDGYKARFINSDEIAQITGRTSFNAESSESDSYFYFDGAFGSDPTWKTQIASSSNPSNYSWLFEHLTNAPTYGGVVDNTVTTWGYWTSDKTVGTHYFFWLVSNQGYLKPEGDGNAMGSRPVIKVLKSKLTNP